MSEKTGQEITQCKDAPKEVQVAGRMSVAKSDSGCANLEQRDLGSLQPERASQDKENTSDCRLLQAPSIHRTEQTTWTDPAAPEE